MIPAKLIIQIRIAGPPGSGEDAKTRRRVSHFCGFFYPHADLAAAAHLMCNDS